MEPVPTVKHKILQVEHGPDYPEEVWKEILSKLWLNENDLEYVIICRQVCTLWAKLVDEMPPQLYWNPYLTYQSNDFKTQEYEFATILKTGNDINNFLSQDFNTDKNPFRNHTLSLMFVKTKNDEENILKILKDYGRHVIKFLYHPFDESPKALTTLPTLLSHMKNIKTLCLNTYFLSNQQVMAIEGKDFPMDLNHLRELVLTRSHVFSKKDVKDDYRIYGKLAESYASQIKSLTLDFLYLDFNQTCIVERFPNLQDLKILRLQVPSMFHPDVLLEPSPEKEWPKLKHLAVCSPYRIGAFDAKITLSFIGLFANTLKRLSLELAPPVYETSQLVALPKLTQLIIPLWMMCRQGVLVRISIERRLKFLLPSLKSVVIEEKTHKFKNKANNERELNEICRPIWPLLPTSVETIFVRLVERSEILLQNFPKVYKCKGNNAAS